MLKKKIVMAYRYRLETSDIDKELMQRLSTLQAQYPNLEWDFNLYGIQFNTYVSFRGYEYSDK